MTLRAGRFRACLVLKLADVPAAGLLGISGAKSVLIDTASSSGASAFENAYLEVASGRYDRVLAIGIQKMTDVSTEEATKIIAGVIDREEAEYGLTMPACGALVAKSLMYEYKLDDKEWAGLAAQWAERASRGASFAVRCLRKRTGRHVLWWRWR